MSWLSDYLRRRKVPPEHDTRRALATYVAKRGFEIGDYTYGRPKIMPWGDARLIIGHYCSIAPDVRIFLGGNHGLSSIATYPFVRHDRSRGDVVIGSDVWIGSGATILSGIKIGHGAIIGAEAVVTKDVPPFAIVAGNPAKLVRHRFEESVIADLLKSRWWDLNRSEVVRLAPLLAAEDPSAALAELSRLRAEAND